MKIRILMEEKLELDDYFIMRLPLEEANYVRKHLHTKPKKIKKILQLEFEDNMKSAKVYIKNRQYEARLVNLPAIIEVSKTTNNINIYKIGCISQMLVVGTDEVLDKIKTDNWPHGLTLPLKNVRKQRFRKTMRNHEDVKEAADIQKEISLLLRTDYEAVSSRFEIIYEKPIPTEITEESLFGTVSGTDSDESSGSVASNYDIIEFN